MRMPSRQFTASMARLVISPTAVMSNGATKHAKTWERMAAMNSLGAAAGASTIASSPGRASRSSSTRARSSRTGVSGSVRTTSIARDRTVWTASTFPAAVRISQPASAWDASRPRPISGWSPTSRTLDMAVSSLMPR